MLAHFGWEATVVLHSMQVLFSLTANKWTETLVEAQIRTVQLHFHSDAVGVEVFDEVKDTLIRVVIVCASAEAPG